MKDVVTIYSVGDIFLGEHPVTLNHGVNSIVKSKGCDFLFAKVKDHLKGADIVCGNLEGIISPKRENETGIKSAIYWGQLECARSLKSAGFNCLFLANNHNAQHGRDALERTCQLLDQMGIKWTGFNRTDPSFKNPAIFEVRGLRVAFSAYCETQQYNLHSPILPIANIENIKRDVAILKKDNGIVVISLHWGDEFVDYPSPRQIRMAHEVIDNGADLILGHHSHTVQGIERYKKGLIAYSLGSFVKDLWDIKLRESVILECEISLEGIQNFRIMPIFINDNYQPEVYEGEAARKFLKRFEVLSKNIEGLDSIEFEELEKAYLREVRKLRMRDKALTFEHYLANMFKYDKKLLIENILLMVKRRIYRKNM